MPSASTHRRPNAQPPQFAFHPVRTRTLEHLLADPAAWPRITSVIAPMGYGKTVLLSSLHARLRDTGAPAFWVGLDDRDAEVGLVIDALWAVLGLAETDAASADATPHSLLIDYASVDRRIDALIDALARMPEGTALFIDNLNSCTDPALSRLLDALIFRTGNNVRCLWSSSTRLPFNFARAKLQGLVRQIGLGELSLDGREAGELLGSELGQRIGPLGIEALLQQTEGWPAALRMAQIILAEADNPLAALEQFSGSDEDIAALLNRHVLEGFAPEVRDFVLGIAQFRVFSAEFADHALEIGNSAAHIDFLLRRNVFVIPLDRQSKWFRLHGLFRGFLANEGRRQVPESRRQAQLRRAAAWSEAQGDWRDAVDYALAANDMGLASRLIEDATLRSVRDRGDIPQYIRWVATLQARRVPLGWETQFWFVWSLVFSRRFTEGQTQLTALQERMDAASPTDQPPPDLERRVEHLRVCVDLFTDRLVDTLQGADRWLDGSQRDHPFNVGSMYCVKGVCEAAAFDFAAARGTMRIAEAIKLQIGAAYGIAWTILINTLVATHEGDYRRARAVLDAGLPATRAALGDDSGVCGTMALVGMKCLVGMGDDAAALALFDLGMRTAGSHGLVDTAAFGLEAAVQLWTGTDDGPIHLDRLREIARTYPPRLSLMLSAYIVQRLLRLGRLDAARQEAALLGLDPEQSARRGRLAHSALRGPDRQALTLACFRDLMRSTEIDLLLATGHDAAAKPAIDKALKQAQSEGRAARQVELMLARAQWALRNDRPAVASKDLILAIGIAARRRILRPFHDQAALIATLVSDALPTAWSFAASEERAFFDEVCQPGNGTLAEQPGQPSHVSPRPRRKAEGDPRALHRTETDTTSPVTATRREIELLTLLDMGLSNPQLAACADVSITTIKWHLQNLYRKLGVSSRAAALARARALNLLKR